MIGVLKHFYFGLTFLMFAGCRGLSDQRVTERYFLVAMDYENSQTSLSYDVDNNDESFVQVIAPMVYAVGCDRRFIILKQHPVRIRYGSPNMSLTYYYILTQQPQPSKIVDDKNLHGPFDERQFLSQRKQLGVPDSVDFTISINSTLPH